MSTLRIMWRMGFMWRLWTMCTNRQFCGLIGANPQIRVETRKAESRQIRTGAVDWKARHFADMPLNGLKADLVGFGIGGHFEQGLKPCATRRKENGEDV